MQFPPAPALLAHLAHLADLAPPQPKGDVRKESRTVELIDFINQLLQNSNFAVQRDFNMQSYMIIPLARNVGMVEWVEQTITLKKIIEELWRRKRERLEISMVRKDFLNDGNFPHDRIPPDTWKQLKEKPGYLQNHYFENFYNPDEWIAATHNYIKSMAIWSLFTYYIGLGDRHCDNIMMKLSDGSIFHVDFDCIFDKGRYLPVAERVSLRLTKNLISALGAFKTKGLFQYYMTELAKFFAKYKQNIIGHLDPFYYDQLQESNTNQNTDRAFQNIRDNISFQGYESIVLGVEHIIERNMDDHLLGDMYYG